MAAVGLRQVRLSMGGAPVLVVRSARAMHLAVDAQQGPGSSHVVVCALPPPSCARAGFTSCNPRYREGRRMSTRAAQNKRKKALAKE